MRKRHVLLYCADAATGEHLAWVMAIRLISLRVSATAVSSPEALQEAVEDGEYDCVVVVRTRLGEQTLADGSRQSADEQVYGLLRTADRAAIEVMNGLPPRAYSCASVLVAGPVGQVVAEMLAAVSRTSSRKRGPKKVAA